MNRRNFLSNLAKAVGCFTILPPATTYERVWKASRPELIVNPDWVNAEYEMEFLIFNQTSFTVYKLQEGKPLNKLDELVVRRVFKKDGSTIHYGLC